MRENLNKSQIERFSRQLVLKNIGAKGQKKILSSKILIVGVGGFCLLYTSPSPRDRTRSRMPSSA